MVNIEVICPQCDNKKDCPWKGKFTIATEEHRLQFEGNYVKCPQNRKIYTSKIYYRILAKPAYEPLKDTIVTPLGRIQATARGKYSPKQRKERRRESRRRNRE